MFNVNWDLGWSACIRRYKHEDIYIHYSEELGYDIETVVLE